MIDLEHRRRCSHCRQVGHRITTCPTLTAASPRSVADAETVGEYDERLAMIAKLREEIDALAIETTQYEDVVVMLGNRIAANRARIVDKVAAIGRLRAGRDR